MGNEVPGADDDGSDTKGEWLGCSPVGGGCPLLCTRQGEGLLNGGADQRQQIIRVSQGIF